MGLEINLLSFIPLSIKSNNLFTSESLLKYFLTQALASCVLLFSIILFNFFIEFNEKINFLMIFILFNASLIMKRGVAPFHFWFPNVIEGLN
jgi:NADH-ubiquinone oxidoreductase chain 2